jgi:hypothetical protein
VECFQCVDVDLSTPDEGTEDAVVKVSDDPSEILDYRALAAKIAERLGHPANTTLTLPSSTVCDTLDTITPSPTPVKQKGKKTRNVDGISTFSFTTPTECVMEDDVVEMKRRFPICAQPRPLVPSYFVIKE